MCVCACVCVLVDYKIGLFQKLLYPNIECSCNKHKIYDSHIKGQFTNGHHDNMKNRVGIK